MYTLDVLILKITKEEEKKNLSYKWMYTLDVIKRKKK